MKQLAKGKWIFIVLILIILLGSSTYLYPYSKLSLNNTYSYNADNVMVKEYVRDLRNFKKIYKNDLRENVFSEDMTSRIDYLLEMTEQKWLVKEDTSKMKRSKLYGLYYDVKLLKESLMGLESKKNYTPYTESLLTYTISVCRTIEKDIIALQNSKNDSRSQLQAQYHNLHVHFMTCFRIFTSYYEAAKNEELSK